MGITDVFKATQFKNKEKRLASENQSISLIPLLAVYSTFLRLPIW